MSRTEKKTWGNLQIVNDVNDFGYFVLDGLPFLDQTVHIESDVIVTFALSESKRIPNGGLQQGQVPLVEHVRIEEIMSALFDVREGGHADLGLGCPFHEALILGVGRQHGPRFLWTCCHSRWESGCCPDQRLQRPLLSIGLDLAAT